VNEQVEEEASVDAVVQKLRMIGDHASALLMLDRALGERKPGD
jgi:ferritin